jgi:hypothetical protein
VELLDAHDILKIPVHQARDLFPGSADDVKLKFRSLARKWHPDTNPGVDQNVFAHIVTLHQRVVASLLVKNRSEMFKSIEGKNFRFEFLSKTSTENSSVLVGRNVIAHVIDKDFADLCENSDAFKFAFAGSEMAEEMRRFLPRLKQKITLDNGSILYVEAKRPDELLLSDLLRTGPVDPRHVAWMITRLLNICCWLEWGGISHGSILPETLLVSPEQHGMALTGPFLSYARVGEKYAALPSSAIDEKPSLLVENVSDISLDLRMVRSIARKALGGVFLPSDLPTPFAQWLTFPPAGTARLDFIGWEKARDASFGAPRFVKWNIDPVAVMTA